MKIGKHSQSNEKEAMKQLTQDSRDVMNKRFANPVNKILEFTIN